MAAIIVLVIIVYLGVLVMLAASVSLHESMKGEGHGHSGDLVNRAERGGADGDVFMVDSQLDLERAAAKARTEAGEEPSRREIDRAAANVRPGKRFLSRR